ncbi:hypothetical protein K3495_g3621 [Podosphaera aphanis]|nr:hypothetical protein K3495_g3621 [Podosphaera aphanis]
MEYPELQHHINQFQVFHGPVSTNDTPVYAPYPERRRAYRHIVPALKQKRGSDVPPLINSNPKRLQCGQKSKRLGKEETCIFWKKFINHPCVAAREKLVIQLRWNKGLDWQSVTDTFNQIMKEKVGPDKWVDVKKPTLQMRENRLTKKILKHERISKSLVAENDVLPAQASSPVDMGAGRVAADSSVEGIGVANTTNIEGVPFISSSGIRTPHPYFYPFFVGFHSSQSSFHTNQQPDLLNLG